MFQSYLTKALSFFKNTDSSDDLLSPNVAATPITSNHKLVKTKSVEKNISTSIDEEAIQVSTFPKFSMWEEARDYYKKLYGDDCKCTLILDKKRGGHSHVMTCTSCTNFRIVFKRTRSKKVANDWYISSDSCLKHGTTTEDGLIGKCDAWREPTASSLVDNALMKSILGKRLKILDIQSILGSQGIHVSETTVKNYVYKHKPDELDMISSFNMLEPYLYTLKQFNPGTIYRVDRMPGCNQFKRVIVIPHYTKPIINGGYAYDIYGYIDAAHMKPVLLHLEWKLKPMVVIAFTGRLVGGHSMLFAWALSYSEKEEDITAMVKLMKGEQIQIDRKEATITSDRGGAILASYESEFILTMQLFCAKHLERNLKPYGQSLVGDFWRARDAPTKARYDEAMEAIRAKGIPRDPQHPTKSERQAAGMYDYLMNKVGDRGWAMYQFYEREQRVYGIRSSNIVEGKIYHIVYTYVIIYYSVYIMVYGMYSILQCIHHSIWYV